MKFAIFIALLACAFAGCVGDQGPESLYDDVDGGGISSDGSDDSGDGSGDTATTFEVKTLSDGSPLPVIFKIDCTRIKDPAKLDCKRYLENTARKSFPAIRKITGQNLEQRCPTMTYVIYNKSEWPHGGAGGMALGNCQIDYLVDVLDPSYFDPNFGPYDVHELLHQHQYMISSFLNDAHPLFGSTQAEAQRVAGDQYSYQNSLNAMQDVVNGTNPSAVCRQAQYKIESAQYLQDTGVAYRYYQNIRADIQDTSTQVSYLLYQASGQNQDVVRTLRDAGCSVNFPK